MATITASTTALIPRAPATGVVPPRRLLHLLKKRRHAEVRLAQRGLRAAGITCPDDLCLVQALSFASGRTVLSLCPLYNLAGQQTATPGASMRDVVRQLLQQFATDLKRTIVMVADEPTSDLQVFPVTGDKEAAITLLGVEDGGIFWCDATVPAKLSRT